MDVSLCTRCCWYRENRRAAPQRAQHLQLDVMDDTVLTQLKTKCEEGKDMDRQKIKTQGRGTKHALLILQRGDINCKCVSMSVRCGDTGPMDQKSVGAKTSRMMCYFNLTHSLMYLNLSITLNKTRTDGKNHWCKKVQTGRSKQPQPSDWHVKVDRRVFQDKTLACVLAPKRTFNRVFRPKQGPLVGIFAPQKALRRAFWLKAGSLASILAPKTLFWHAFFSQAGSLAGILAPKRTLPYSCWLPRGKFYKHFELPRGHWGMIIGSLEATFSSILVPNRSFNVHFVPMQALWLAFWPPRRTL